MIHKFMKINTLILSFILLAALAGCNASRTPVPNTPGENIGFNSTPAPGTANTQRNATDISDKLAGLDSIRKATVVIVGDTALVGLEMESGYSYQQDQNLKNTVENTVKSMDASVKRVAVSEAPDMVRRIGNLAKDVAGGKSAQDLGNEVKAIISSIIPSMK